MDIQTGRCRPRPCSCQLESRSFRGGSCPGERADVRSRSAIGSLVFVTQTNLIVDRDLGGPAHHHDGAGISRSTRGPRFQVKRIVVKPSHRHRACSTRLRAKLLVSSRGRQRGDQADAANDRRHPRARRQAPRSGHHSHRAAVCERQRRWPNDQHSRRRSPRPQAVAMADQRDLDHKMRSRDWGKHNRVSR